MNQRLLQIVNKGYINPCELLLPLYIRSLVLARKYRPSQCMLPPYSAPEGLALQVPRFARDIEAIRKLREYLQPLRPFLINVYIHGSYGSEDENAYSDLDALVIVDMESLQSDRSFAFLIRRLFSAQRLFRRIDPLQHHGWFVLTEWDTADWPQTYFPIELFADAKCLFSGKGEALALHVQTQSQDYQTPFRNLAEEIQRKLRARNFLSNIYALKGLLSQFMLLPTLFMQATQHKGINKKYSFQLAKKDFSRKEWSVMDAISGIRENWHCAINPFQRFILFRIHPVFQRIKGRIPMAIPSDIRESFSDDFCNRMDAYVSSLMKKVK